MNPALYLPADEFAEQFADVLSKNFDIAADFLELSALLSYEGQAFSNDIIRTLEQLAEGEYEDVDAEIKMREDAATAAVNCMASRKNILSESYPFEIDNYGDVVYFIGDLYDVGQNAYLLSLILSNLKSITPLLNRDGVHPTAADERDLRRFFQYFATAAIAGEVGGQAWSFGFPRPDRSGFIPKLSQIWDTLNDGEVGAHASAPSSPKDDGIDVFAWRGHQDGLPGFLFVAAQVASGKNWESKSLRDHIGNAFPKRWFKTPPASNMIPYHVIPFVLPEERFRDKVHVLGNILHRLRVPSRVSEAVILVHEGVKVEAFELLAEASLWLQSYVNRIRTL